MSASSCEMMRRYIVDADLFVLLPLIFLISIEYIFIPTSICMNIVLSNIVILRMFPVPPCVF